MSSLFQIDDKDFRALLLKLETKELRKITKQAMRAGANVIRKQAVANYRALFPNSQKYKALGTYVWQNGLIAVVRRAVIKGNDSEKKKDKAKNKYGDDYSSLHVLDVLEKGSGARTSRGKSAGRRNIKSPRGALRKYAFLKRAEETKKREALDEISRVLKEKFEKMKK